MTEHKARDLQELIYLLYAKHIRGLSRGELLEFVAELIREPGRWRAVLREDEDILIKPGVCAHCGSTRDVKPFPVVPPERAAGNPRLRRILSEAEASVPACESCRRQQDGADVLEWYAGDVSSMPKGVLHVLLRTLYTVHLTQGTLDSPDPNQDGQLDIYDLGVVMSYFIMPKGKKERRRDRGTRQDS